LADASVLVLAQRSRTVDLLCTDERYFRAPRGPGAKPFRLLPYDAQESIPSCGARELDLLAEPHAIKTRQRVAHLVAPPLPGVSLFHGAHQARGEIVCQSIPVTLFGAFGMRVTNPLIEPREHRAREPQIESLVAQHEEHVLVDLGLQLQLELRRRPLAARA